MSIRPPPGLLELRLFGSHAAGRQDEFSDVDVLAHFCADARPSQEEIQDFARLVTGVDADCTAISDERLSEIMNGGSLFAWHLHLESRQIWVSETYGLCALGPPPNYSRFTEDATNFANLLRGISLQVRGSSPFELCFEAGLAYLAIRNIAMCACLALTKTPDFTRNAPYSRSLQTVQPLQVAVDLYQRMSAARLWSQRCVGMPPELTIGEVAAAVEAAVAWTDHLLTTYSHECALFA